jgi:hypothetical protein
VVDSASIEIYRGRANFLDLGMTFKVMLDGGVIGEILPRESKRFTIGAGEFSLAVRFLYLRGSRELTVSLEPGEVKYFTCQTNWIGFAVLHPAHRRDFEP